MKYIIEYNPTTETWFVLKQYKNGRCELVKGFQSQKSAERWIALRE